jgi:hypothetical protein
MLSHRKSVDFTSIRSSYRYNYFLTSYIFMITTILSRFLIFFHSSALVFLALWASICKHFFASYPWNMELKIRWISVITVLVLNASSSHRNCICGNIGLQLCMFIEWSFPFYHHHGSTCLWLFCPSQKERFWIYIEDIHRWTRVTLVFSEWCMKQRRIMTTKPVSIKNLPNNEKECTSYYLLYQFWTYSCLFGHLCHVCLNHFLQKVDR